MKTVRLAFAFLAVSTTVSLLSASSIKAQTGANPATPAPINNPLAIKRAFNLARDTGIKINGGLSNYRPARCMFDSTVNNRCLAKRDAYPHTLEGTIIFHSPLALQVAGNAPFEAKSS